MKLTRIDSVKNLKQEVNRLRIEIGDKTYTLTESFGKLHILSHDDSLSVYPCVANVIEIK
jgi:hypothetical protein